MAANIDHGLDSPVAGDYLKMREREEKMLKFNTAGVGRVPIIQTLQDPYAQETVEIATAHTESTIIPANNTIVIEDDKVQVEISCDVLIPETNVSYPFAVKFTARKVDSSQDSISIFMNDVLSLTLPRIPAVLKLTINNTASYKVAYAGGMMKIGAFRVLSFIVVD